MGVKARLLAVTAAAFAAVSLGGGAPQAAPTLPAALAFSRGETTGGGIFVWERNGRVRPFARSGSAPTWSPDGRRLAYVAPAELGATDLYVADADGSHRAALTRSEAADESSPDWAPDGRSLAVDRDGTLVVVRADGASERLTALGHVATEAVPSAFSLDPDGHFLFAAGSASNRLASYRVNRDTGALTPLGTYDVGKRPMWVLMTRLGG